MILVCGEALYDMFATEVADGFTFEARVAGSPFNVAVGLSRLGAPASLLTGLSKDFLGDKLARRLEQEGVSLTHIQRLNAPTTTAYVSLGEDGSATYAFYGSDAADRSLPIETQVDLSGIEALHFGSYSFVVGSTADLFLSLMRRASDQFISLDPNVRPTVEPDMNVWRTRLTAALPYCDLVKLSDEDAASLYPGADLDEVAKRLLNEGARVVAITRGKEGAMIFTNEFRLSAPAIEGDIVDTVGAGDSFQAAMLAAIINANVAAIGSDIWASTTFWEQTLHFALSAAATTCSRRGADLPYAVDLG